MIGSRPYGTSVDHVLAMTFDDASPHHACNPARRTPAARYGPKERRESPR